MNISKQNTKRLKTIIPGIDLQYFPCETKSTENQNSDRFPLFVLPKTDRDFIKLKLLLESSGKYVDRPIYLYFHVNDTVYEKKFRYVLPEDLFTKKSWLNFQCTCEKREFPSIFEFRESAYQLVGGSTSLFMWPELTAINNQLDGSDCFLEIKKHYQKSLFVYTAGW